MVSKCADIYQVLVSPEHTQCQEVTGTSKGRQVSQNDWGCRHLEALDHGCDKVPASRVCVSHHQTELVIATLIQTLRYLCETRKTADQKVQRALVRSHATTSTRFVQRRAPF